MPSGSKPGERRGGRKKGTPNKSTKEIQAIARKYGPAAIAEAARLAGLVKVKGKVVGAAESEAVRATCLNTILDRAYGKPTTTIGIDPEDNPWLQVTRIELVAPGSG